MNFLPILGRELRVRGRSRANHWGRLGVVTVGLLACLPPLLWSSPLSSAPATGRAAFNAMVGAVFVLCCGAALLTADSISRERRDGTLGLLLLTRVRGFEVLLGKLVSSGLASALGLAALLPVLMLPVLAGGVTGGEAIRKGLALFDTLFLALCAGLWASARSAERFRTARTATLLVVGLVLLPLGLGWVFRGSHLELVSPLEAVLRADVAYRFSSRPFWLCLGLVQVMGWLLMFGAMACLRGGRWREEEAPMPVRVAGEWTGVETSTAEDAGESVSADESFGARPRTCPWCGRSNGSAAKHCAECGTDLRPRPVPRPQPYTPSTAPTPLHWLLRRRGGLAPVLWLAAGLSVVNPLFIGIAGNWSGLGLSLLGIYRALGLASLAITGSLFAWAASRFFVEARRTRELELLVTTPVGAEALLTTQWDILKRAAIGPVLLTIAPMALQGLLVFGPLYLRPDLSRLPYAASLWLSALTTVLRIGALCWVGLWLGLRAGTQARAILWTLLLVDAPPYLLGLGWSLAYRSLASAVGDSTFLSLLAPHVPSLLYLLCLIAAAHRQAHQELTGAEPVALHQVLASPLLGAAAAVRRARQWPSVPGC